MSCQRLPQEIADALLSCAQILTESEKAAVFSAWMDAYGITLDQWEEDVVPMDVVRDLIHRLHAAVVLH